MPIRKDEKAQMDDLSLHLKIQEKEKQTQSKQKKGTNKEW